MASYRLRYEIKPSTLHPQRFAVVKIRGRLQLGYIATGLSKADAVAFKKLKEQQGEQASVRNRASSRNRRVNRAAGSAVASGDNFLDGYDRT